MNLTQSRKDFWIHMDPVGSDNFMVHGRTFSEPRYDEHLGHYVVTNEGKLCNDRISCVNPTAKTFLPEALWNSVTPGKRAHVYNYTFWELKDENDEVIKPVVQKTGYMPETYFEMQQFTDHLIFGLRGKAEFHERYSSFNTRQDDPENPLKVQYVNKYGQVITHGCRNINDAYIMIGCPGDFITPYNIALLWGSDVPTARRLDTLLIEAYLMGIRFIAPPTDNVIRMTVKVVNSDVIKITPQNEYYGFAENMLFSAKRDYRSDPYLGTRSLERCLIGAVVAYRWFFNNPDLQVTLSLIHDENKEKVSSWKDEKDYSKYMQNVESYDNGGVLSLQNRINSNVNQKFTGYKSHPFFRPEDYINNDFFAKMKVGRC